MKPLTFLCLASFFKGPAFFDECHQRGVHVVLLTTKELFEKPWPETINEKFCMPDLDAEEDMFKAVSYLARTREFDAVIAIDEYVVEMGAKLREHMRVPGGGLTQVRQYRDKLLMRIRGKETGLPVPEFVHVLNHARIGRFLDSVPAPWILKPRAEAGAVKMKKLSTAAEVWEAVEELGDDQSKYLLEQFVPGDILHVDSVVWDGKPIFAAPHRYWTPPFNVWHQGGVFGSASIDPKDPLHAEVLDLNKQLIKAIGLQRGVTHSEFIRAHDGGRVYFLETAARVGGANIDALVRGTTNVDLWREWANVEAANARGETYRLPKTKNLVGGLLVCLARQEQPDLSSFDDEEVVWTASEEYHASMVVASKSPQRIERLMEAYRARLEEDVLAVAPPVDHPA